MKENIVKIAQLILYIVLILLFLVNLVILGFQCSSITLTSIITLNFDLQIFLFLFILLLLLTSFLSIFFIKSLNKYKIPLLLLLIILQMIYFKFSLYIPTVNKVIEIEACIESGNLWDYTNNTCCKTK